MRDGLACVFVLPRQLVLAGQTLASISGPAQKLLDGALCIQHNTNLSNLTQSHHPSNPWLYLYKLLVTTDFVNRELTDKNTHVFKKHINVFFLNKTHL